MPNAYFKISIASLMFVVLVSGCSRKTTSAAIDENPDRRFENVENAPRTSDESDNSDRSTVAGLHDIFFAFDDHRLSADSRSILGSNAARLKEMPSLRVMIEGHCDERGTTEYNLALGQRRADAAKLFLVDLGIDPERLVTVSYGEERPFDAGHSESAWAQNRRAHFTETR